MKRTIPKLPSLHGLVRICTGIRRTHPKYLSAEQRVQALSLSKAIFAIADAVKNGSRETEPLLEQAKRSVTEAGGRVDYFESVDAETLEPVIVVERPVLFAAAVFYGTTRLIDNVVVNP